ncbi:Uncharacterised protein [Raoultella planticola]|uniref:Uncharacterized protein n=1 Tax=Raoultella planticola TaxID=575 RepID=A0A485A6I8_RAOPL|nr:Uncharacterised protein [Raoultella planticola]
MPRTADVEAAWFRSIVIEPNGRRTVTTFRDVSTEEGDNRTFQLFNPNGGAVIWAFLLQQLTMSNAGSV